MAEEVREDFDVRSRVTKGETGVFEVYLNRQLVFSKEETGRFPEIGEISEIIKEKLHIPDR